MLQIRDQLMSLGLYRDMSGGTDSREQDTQVERRGQSASRVTIAAPDVSRREADTVVDDVESEGTRGLDTYLKKVADGYDFNLKLAKVCI